MVINHFLTGMILQVQQLVIFQLKGLFAVVFCWRGVFFGRPEKYPFMIMHDFSNHKEQWNWHDMLHMLCFLYSLQRFICHFKIEP